MILSLPDLFVEIIPLLSTNLLPIYNIKIFAKFKNK